MQPVKDRPQKKRRQKVFLKSGTEFTPELEDKLVAEAERGYDLSEAMWRIRTRPLLPDSPTMPKVTLSLPQAEFNALRWRAEEEGRAVSDLAREILTRYLNENS
jgi:hypothetical protein